MITHTLTINKIIDAFPEECREIIPKVNRELKKKLKPYTQHCKTIRLKHYDQFDELFFLQIIKIFYKPEVIEKQIKRNKSILQVLDAPEGSDKITDAMIEQAKEVPIATLYDFEKIQTGTMKFSACCPFHNEKTGSFFVYSNNTFYCFGCHVGGDAIEFVKKLNGYNFPDTIKYLMKQ